MVSVDGASLQMHEYDEDCNLDGEVIDLDFSFLFIFFLSQNMEIRSNKNKCSDLICVCRGLSQSRRNNSFVFNCGAQHLTNSGENLYKFAADRIVCKIKMKIIQSDSDNLIARAVSIRIKHNSNQTDQSSPLYQKRLDILSFNFV